MNMQNGLKKLLRLVITVAVIFLAVRWCSSQFGSVITLPGGSGGTIGSSEKTGSEGSGGWFSPKKQPSGTTSNQDPDIEDLERELGIGKYQGQKPSTQTQTTQTPSTTTTALAPLTFKGIPLTGSSSAFGSALVKAGFRNAGNGTYTGDFAGYSGCKVTPSGNNPVQEVRVDFPVISDWDSLEKSYDSLQASLTQKYGIEPVTSKNNNLAIYNLPNGTITLDADVKNQSSWHVILKYSNLATSASSGSIVRNPIDDL